MGMDVEKGELYSPDEMAGMEIERLNQLTKLSIGEKIEIKGGKFMLISVDVNLGLIKLRLLPKGKEVDEKLSGGKTT